MKKITSILVSLLLIFSLIPVMGSVAEEGYTKTVWEDFSDPEFTSSWGDWEDGRAGKWSGFYIPAWANALTAGNFSDEVLTPSGDNFSANANMSFVDGGGTGAMLRKDNAVGTGVNTSADGFYITMYSESIGDIAVQIRNDASDLSVGKVIMYTILEVKEGWYTYFIPYSSIVHKGTGFTNGSNVSDWKLSASNFQTTTTPFEYFGLVNCKSADVAARTNFKGQTVTRALDNAPAKIVIDEIGFYTGTAPAGQVEEASIPLAYNCIEDCANPQLGGSWMNGIDPGKWQAFNLDGNGSSSISAGDFSNTIKTPWGDDKSLVADMSSNEASVRKGNIAGTHFDITAEGFYLTMYCSKDSDLIFRVNIGVNSGAATWINGSNFYTIIEAKEGWKTYFIPYKNIHLESNIRGTDHEYQIDSGNYYLGNATMLMLADTEFFTFSIEHLASSSTEDRVNFKGEKLNRALVAAGPKVVIDDIGYYAGTAPEGLVRTEQTAAPEFPGSGGGNPPSGGDNPGDGDDPGNGSNPGGGNPGNGGGSGDESPNTGVVENMLFYTALSAIAGMAIMAATAKRKKKSS